MISMDYRNMPIASLNANIPTGRGMIKWAPFATMPEQFENVALMVDNQTKIERPELSEDRIDEMNVILQEAIHEKRLIKVEYYYDGRRYSLTVKIVRVDTWSMMLIGERAGSPSSGEMIFIPFMDILNILLV